MENNIIDFIKENISPTMEDISMISDKYKEVSEVIGWEVFQGGSCARKTALKPVNDLDIINVFSSDKSIEDAQIVLNDLYDKLLNYQSHLWFKKIKMQKSSIGLYYEESEDDFSIDIVPAIDSWSVDINFWKPIYLVPEIQKMNKRKRLDKYNDPDWKADRILSAPKSYKSYADKLDELSQKRFRYFTKFIKYRRRWAKKRFQALNQKLCLKSFHIEQICGRIIEKNPDLELYWLVSIFFETITIIINSKKQFEDLAYLWSSENRRIDEYIEDKEKNTIEFKQWMNNEVARVKNILKQIDVSTEKDEIWSLLKKIAFDSTKENTEQKLISLDNYKWPHWWM